MFLTVFPLFCAKERIANVTLRSFSLFKERLERFVPVALDKRATVRNSLRSLMTKKLMSEFPTLNRTDLGSFITVKHFFANYFFCENIPVCEGTVSRDFLQNLFCLKNSTRPHMNRQKRFCKFLFRNVTLSKCTNVSVHSLLSIPKFGEKKSKIILTLQDVLPKKKFYFM